MMHWLARRMRNFADRIDRAGAPKATHWHFTFELRQGLVFNEEGRGCRVWYYGDADYERAHSEARNPGPRVDWKALAEGRRPCVSWPTD